MKHIFSLLFISLFIVSCQKENTIVEQPVPEQNIADASYGTDAAQRMDIYLPAGRTTTTTKAIIIVHGGAWISGDKTEMNQFIPVVKQQLPDYAIFNINYRLGALPATNPFPTQENDVKTAVDFIINKSSEYKFNTGKVVLLGASAGAHLALLQAYKHTTPKVKAVVSLFGPTDMAALYNFYPAGSLSQIALQLLLGGSPTVNASMYQSSSPVNYATAQSPPTLLLHGTADDIVPIAQSTILKTKLETVGASVKMVTYQNAGHGDWDDATFLKAYGEIVSFLMAKNP
ncbi:MAG: alpha/beta hydrolase [Chitinophagaceae bacterium]|nr:MAG: alpha/beta hydrolase [Chitinophagaceae bacterium]